MRTLCMRYATLALLITAELAGTPAWAGGNHAGGGGTPMPMERRPESTESRTPHRSSPPAASQWPTTDEKDSGRPGMVEAVARRLEIGIDDSMRITPDELQITQGETVRLRIRNNSSASLALVLGTQAEIAEQAELMQQPAGRELGDASTAHIYPGQSGEIIWQFTRPGTFHLANLVPGHPQAGSQTIITVMPPGSAANSAGPLPTTGNRLLRHERHVHD